MNDEKRLDGLSNIDPEWFAKKAAQEGDLEIGCGVRMTHTVNLTPEEIAVLERLVNPVASDLRSSIAALELRLAEAERVIEPFADILSEYDPDDEDDFTPGTLVVGSVTNYDISLGDLRAARAWKEGK